MLPATFESALEHLAETIPGKTFCIFSGSGERLTYGELRSRVANCSQSLRSLGVGPGVRVAIRLPATPQLLIHLLAVFNAGGVAVPMAITMPQSAVKETLQALDPHLVIDSGDSQNGAASTIEWLETKTAITQYPKAREEKLSHSACLGVFTSGSTDLPSCVLLSRANLLAGAAFVIEAHAITGDDTVVCCMPLSHINGIVTTVLAPLLSGGTVVFLQGTFMPRDFLHAMKRYSATWFSAAPLHYELLLYSGADGAHMETCRFGRSASAPLNPDAQLRFEALYGIPVIQTLGLTETSGQVFSNPIDPGAARPGSVGRPVGNQAEIVDSRGRRVSDGTNGEIRVKGPNVMLGYFGDPGSSSETLRNGWLYTGDLGYRDADGFFYITGRKKLIAIFGGENISLVAVEQAALRVPFVTDAAAVARECPGIGEVVDLYYAGGGADPAAEKQDISRALLEILPSHHALGEITWLENLPRSESGKLLRYTLL